MHTLTHETNAVSVFEIVLGWAVCKPFPGFEQQLEAFGYVSIMILLIWVDVAVEDATAEFETTVTDRPTDLRMSRPSKEYNRIRLQLEVPANLACFIAK